MRRGNSRGRGRGNFKANSNRDERESALDRLGKVIYPKTANDKNSKKYKFIRSSNTSVNSCIATLPAEARIKLLTKRFLKSYYDIFDQAGRANLESQYNSDAFFSFSSTIPVPTVGRNLLEIRDPTQRLSMLVHDKTNIAKALATFSPTEHLINNMSVDVPFYIVSPMSITSMQLVVTGVFKDTSQTTNALRAFTRVFVIKHTSMDKQGEPIYEIFNDLFMLQAPTPDQIKKFHQESQQMKRLQAFQQPDRSNASTTSAGGASGALNRDQENQIRSIMAKTKMNRTGSLRLLEDCNWIEDNAMVIFNQLLPENKIPQEFFTPT